MRLAIVGDIHVYELWTAPWRLLGKRLAGATNLWLKRRFKFDVRCLEPLFVQLRELKVDVVLFSGDLTTTALPREFDQAARVLRQALQHRCLFVPGNHDKYTFASAWRGNMTRAFGPHMPTGFPHAEQLTPNWRLLAIDSATPRLFTSRGRVGDRQLDAMCRELDELKSRHGDDAPGLVVLTHYPLDAPSELPAMRWAHRLADADALRDALAGYPGPTVYIHGHVHLPWVWAPEARAATDAPGADVGADDRDGDPARRRIFTSTPPGVSVDLNAGSPCLRGSAYPAGQGFWTLALPDAARGVLRAGHHRPGGGTAPGHVTWDELRIDVNL